MDNIRTLQDLVTRIGPRLKLRWLTPPPGPALPFRSKGGRIAGQSLVGSLNCIHPNRIQIIGPAELRYLQGLSERAYLETVDRLFSGKPLAILFTDDLTPAEIFLKRAQRSGTSLLLTPRSDEEATAYLQYFLTRALAERRIIHGVFMDVLGTGVLLVGDPAVGKSELALELIHRGHRLIADDAPEFAHIAPEVLEGTCPRLLRDFLEVRGLGILNIRAMFGESAIEQRKPLDLIINLRALAEAELAQIDRFKGTLSSRSILGVEVPEIIMPVAPGRNLAVLVEAAVRHQTLRTRGYDAGADFSERQEKALRELQSSKPASQGDD